MNRAKLLKKITSGKHDDGSSGWQGATMLLAIPVLAILARLFWYIEFKTRDSVRRKSVAALFDKLYFQDIVCLVWFLIDAFTHLSIELGYVVLALTNTAEKSDSVLGWIWREYARADARWAVRDANVISLELLTVGIGFLCLLLAYGVLHKCSWRHPLQMIVCTAELYGGWMTFCPEWIEGSPNLLPPGKHSSEVDRQVLLWVYLVFMNGLWVVIPALLLWDSYARMASNSHLCRARMDLPEWPNAGVPTHNWWVAAISTIVLYMVLVPAVLFSAAGVPVLDGNVKEEL